MTTVAQNVTVPSTGDFLFAVLGTALPTTPSVALNAAFKSVGYIGEDGVVITQDETSNKIKAFQSADVVRVVQTEHSVTVKLTMLETNANSLDIFFKGNFSAGIGSIKAGMAPHKSWVIHEIDGTSIIRHVLPDAQAIDIGDLTYVNGSAAGYPITLECFADANGAKVISYFATATVSV